MRLLKHKVLVPGESPTVVVWGSVCQVPLVFAVLSSALHPALVHGLGDLVLAGWLGGSKDSVSS